MPFKKKTDYNNYMRRYMRKNRETTKELVELGKAYKELLAKGLKR